MSDCFYFENGQNKCFNILCTPSMSHRIMLGDCYFPEKCKYYRQVTEKEKKEWWELKELIP